MIETARCNMTTLIQGAVLWVNYFTSTGIAMLIINRKTVHIDIFVIFTLTKSTCKNKYISESITPRN
jgi:hypothetical protein